MEAERAQFNMCRETCSNKMTIEVLPDNTTVLNAAWTYLLN